MSTEALELFGKAPTEGDRSLTYSFDGPEVAPEDMDIPGDDGWRWRIVVSVRHDKNAKAYRATVRRCKYMRRDTYAMESTDMFSRDDNAHLGSATVARYSDKGLAMFAETVLRKARMILELAGPEADRTPLERMLAQAEAWGAPAAV